MDTQLSFTMLAETAPAADAGILGHIIALVALTALCAVCLWKSRSWAGSQGQAGRDEGATSRLTAARRIRWVALAFVPSSLMLGAFPWKFKGGEAAFCRAVAFVE